jgi:hypothetical protein
VYMKRQQKNTEETAKGRDFAEGVMGMALMAYLGHRPPLFFLAISSCVLKGRSFKGCIGTVLCSITASVLGARGRGDGLVVSFR